MFLACDRRVEIPVSGAWSCTDDDKNIQLVDVAKEGGEGFRRATGFLPQRAEHHHAVFKIFSEGLRKVRTGRFFCLFNRLVRLGVKVPERVIDAKLDAFELVLIAE